MPYQSNWNSIGTHATPQWLKDAKFGIYTHWGIYSVPAFGPNGSWYGCDMYKEGTPQFEHHVKTYGHPSKFGYKDFIPMFTAERFNPDEWAELFRRAGAKFAGPVGEHHDGFSMWDSGVNPWNAAKMGPKRDVVGELEKAYRAQGMRFMVALHHMENWYFYPHWRPDFDTSDPRYSGLYGPLHNLDWMGNDIALHEWWLNWKNQDKPSREYLEFWLSKAKEVVDGYRPDLLWFDFGLGYVQEHYKTDLISYYLNRAEERGREAAVTYKTHDLAPWGAVVDLELGRYDKLTYHDWITDTTVDDGEGWGYLKETGYKSAETLVHYLIDNVSKNGYLLLNVGPKPNGEIPEQARELLMEMGRWLDVNGEAIYGTTPWMVYGEGPTKMENSGSFNEQPGGKLKYKAEDIRFTVKGDTLYAICLGLPHGEALITSAGSMYPGEIERVTMLGADGELPWELKKEGLVVKTPDRYPCKYACTIAIRRRNPFAAR